MNRNNKDVGSTFVVAYRGAPPIPKGPSARVQNISVTCPTCHAVPGEPCATLSGGKPVRHESRRRMALRAGNVTRQAPPAEDTTLPVCPECGRRVKTRGDGRLQAHTTRPTHDLYRRVSCYGEGLLP